MYETKEPLHDCICLRRRFGIPHKPPFISYMIINLKVVKSNEFFLLKVNICGKKQIYSILRLRSSQPENVMPRLPRITAEGTITKQKVINLAKERKTPKQSCLSQILYSIFALLRELPCGQIHPGFSKCIERTSAKRRKPR